MLKDDQILLNIYRLIQKRKRLCDQVIKVNSDEIYSIIPSQIIVSYGGFLILLLVFFIVTPTLLQMTIAVVLFGGVILFWKKIITKLHVFKHREWGAEFYELDSNLIILIKSLAVSDLDIENAEGVLRDCVKYQHEFIRLIEIFGINSNMLDHRQCLKILENFALLFKYKIF